MHRIVALALVGIPMTLWDGTLLAQETYEFSTVVELQNGIVAGNARLMENGAIDLELMAPGQVVEWFEIRDSERGGRLVATTRRQNRQAPSIEVLGLGQVLSDADGSVGIAIDTVVELTLALQATIDLQSRRSPAFVVVGFDRGESAAFPIGTGFDDAMDGGIVMEQPDDEGGAVFMPIPDDGGAVVTVAPPEGQVAMGTRRGENAGSVAVTRTPPGPLPGGPTAPPGPQVRAGPQPPTQPATQPPTLPTGPGPLPPAQPTGPGPQPPALPAGPGSPPTAQGAGVQGPAPGGVAGTDWNATATSLRGRNGERFVFRCPATGTAGRGPWGGEVYADHSSVCTAAVHAGLITFASGGFVTIEIRAGLDFYAGSPGQGGVTSSAAGGWPGSFAFVR